MAGSHIDNNDNAREPALSPLLDQSEIDAALAAMAERAPESSQQRPKFVPRSAPPSPRKVDLGLVTQSEIDRALNKRNEVKTASAPRSSEALGQAEIDKLLAAADAEPTNFAAAEAALRRIEEVESGASDLAVGADASSDGLLSQDELDTLLVGGYADESAAGSGTAGPADDHLEIEAVAAPLTLGQNELDALLASHPLIREDAPAPLPHARAAKVEEAPENAHLSDSVVYNAAQENAAANVGLENLAAAVPNPDAADQPLGKDLIDSLVAQAAQAAASPGSGDPNPSVTAAALSDDDFADIGMAAPATPSEDEDSSDSTEEVVDETSPVVARRLKRRAKLPLKLVASLAASVIAGSTVLLYFWPDEVPQSDLAKHDTVESNPVNLEDAIIVAKEYMGKGEYIAAMRQLGAAIRTAEPGALLNEARFLHVEAGYRSLPPAPRDVDTETVLKNIEDVIALNPTYSRNPEALSWKAELYARTGSPTAARDTYARILGNYPAALNTDKVLLEHARLCVELNFLDDASRSLERLVSEYPDSPHKSAGQMMLARSYEENGRAADAEALYALVAAERTDSRIGAEAALGLARLANRAGDLPRAILALETRLQTATTVEGNDGVYIELAKAYRASGKPVESVRVARELLGFFPESAHVPEAVVELTRGLEQTGDRGQALELAQQAAERFDTNVDVARNRAVMLKTAGNARGAAEAMIKADELGANDPALVLDAGKIYITLGEPEKAETLFQQVLETFPQTTQAAEASVELARIQYERGEIAPAIDRLATLAASPWASTHDLAIQSALGGIYAELGLTRRATAAYEKIASRTDDPELLARAATALLNNGALGSALPVVRKIDQTRLSSKSGFELLMAQGRALLDVDAEQALAKMQQAFESYPVERSPEDYEFLVRACLDTGKTARARVLITDFDAYVETHPEERERLQRTAALWGDALYKAGDYRAALDAYALAEAPATSSPEQRIEGEPEVENADAVWARFQRANAMIKLEDYWNSVPILDELAASESAVAEDARIKAEYARLEQRLRNQAASSAGG